jgi:hypothetical protein
VAGAAQLADDGLGGFAEGAAFFGEQQQDLRRKGVDGQPAGQGEK